MKNSKSLFFALAFVLLTGLSSSFAQGQIFSKAEADKLFGPVLKSVVVPVADVKAMLDKCKSVVMFDVDADGAAPQLIAVDDARHTLNAYGKSVASTRVLHKYSKAKVAELLSTAAASAKTTATTLATDATTTVTVEIRATVLSVTVGDYTLEKSAGCPPWCD